MGKYSILITKTFQFAIRIIKVYKFLKFEQKEYVISGQILRSGTSIGALVREAEHGESRKDFFHKLNISLKETNETIYWLELLHASEYLTKAMFDSLNQDATEILRMLIASVKTVKGKIPTFK